MSSSDDETMRHWGANHHFVSSQEMEEHLKLRQEDALEHEAALAAREAAAAAAREAAAAQALASADNLNLQGVANIGGENHISGMSHYASEGANSHDPSKLGTLKGYDAAAGTALAVGADAAAGYSAGTGVGAAGGYGAGAAAGYGVGASGGYGAGTSAAYGEGSEAVGAGATSFADEATAPEGRGRRLGRPQRLVSPGALMVFLLKNYLDREDNRFLFESLLRQQVEVEMLCRSLFLRLVVDAESGYAYVRSLADEELPEDNAQRPPQLLIRRPLPFYDSLILILLRQRLLEFDMSGQFGRLVLERHEIVSLVKTFIHNVNNDKKLDDNIHKAIDNLCSLGLLAKNRSATELRNNLGNMGMSSAGQGAGTLSHADSAKGAGKGRSSAAKENRDAERIEIKRIISVIVTPEILKQADEILSSYSKHIQEGGRGKNRLLDEDDDDLV